MTHDPLCRLWPHPTLETCSLVNGCDECNLLRRARAATWREAAAFMKTLNQGDSHGDAWGEFEARALALEKEAP